MARLFSDSFDSYANSANMANRWTTTNGFTWVSGQGRSGGAGLQYGLFANQAAPMAASVTLGAKVRVGFWIKNGSPTTAVASIASFIGVSSDQRCLELAASGGFIIARKIGDPATALITSSINVCDAAYHWVEVEWLLATGATGTCEMWVDGVSQGSVTGVATIVSSQVPLTGFMFRGATTSIGGGTMFFDDVLVWDDSGGVMDTFPIGQIRMSCHVPNAAGASTQWTPSTGTNWSCVSGGYSTTTPYVETTVTAQTDLYSHAALGYTPPAVHAVVVSVFAEDAASGSTVAPAVYSAGTQATGTPNVLMSGSFKLFSQPFYVDPNTGAAWTASGVNAMQFGIVSG